MLALPVHLSNLSMSASPKPALREGILPPPDEQGLAQAFASFTEVAHSLERSYTHLQKEVAKLRQELEETNRDLAASLEGNRRMRLHLNRTLEGLPCGVLVTEADDSVSIANPETLRLLGAVCGCELGCLNAVPLWLKDLLEDARATVGEREHSCRSGGLEWISIRHTELDAADGSSSIFILRDISEAKRLQRAQETLGRRQALAEMSALLAHEVRNPLGSLELFAGLLTEARLGAEPREWAQQLQAGLRTLAATVNNVLHFHGQPPPNLAPTDLGRLIGSLEAFLRPLARQSGVRLELAQGLDGVLAEADGHQLQQVLLNLGLNAFRFMSAGGVLRIAGRVIPAAGRRAAQVEILDTGPGIREEHLERIFEPGFTTRAGSPGLGLAVCKTILEQHGGSIGVASRAGFGATFRLQLPVLEASE
jgi:two-component system, sensor histidine kinase FlrB